MRKCPCGTTFDPGHTTRKYCSPDCHVAQLRRRRRHEYICGQCGQPYKSRLTGVKWPICTACRMGGKLGSVYEPTLEEIDQACRQIRSRWTGTPSWSAPTELVPCNARREVICPECRALHRSIPPDGWPCLACRVRALVAANGGVPLSEEQDADT
jgi:ribosomal protein L37AE/L43A